MTLACTQFTVEELTALEDWNAISELWDNLFDESKEASIFNSYPFLRCLYSKYFNSKYHKMAILMVKDETGKPIGAVPLIRMKRWIAGFPVKTIALMDKIVITDRIQFLLPSRRKEQLQAVMQHLRADADNWDVIELREQLIDDDYEAIAREVFEDPQIHDLNITTPALEPFLKMDFGSDGWDRYLQTRSKKHRQKWRNLQNRLSREGVVTVTRHTGESGLLPYLAEYKDLERKSWKVNTPYQLSAEVSELYLDLAEALRPQGDMHFVFLRLNGVPIAGLIGMSFNERYAALQTVFDEAYAKNSSGFLVGGYDMQWTMENGFAEYDFMSGALTDKLLWTDSYRSIHTIRIVRKQAFMGLFYLLKFQIRPALREVLSKIGLATSEKHETFRRITSKFDKHNSRLKGNDENSATSTNLRV